MACVVKANAYGHGDKKIAKELENLGIDFFCVATLDEAIRLRNVLKPTTSILILGYTPYDYVEEVVKYNLIQTITSVRYMKNAYKYGILLPESLVSGCHFSTSCCRTSGFRRKPCSCAFGAIM